MDSKEFKLYVRKVLLDNGFNEHSNPTCYIKDMGDYYLRFFVDKSTWSDSYGVDGDVSGRSVGAACLSLIVWPGIGQAVNKNTKEKNVTHAVLGFTGIFRIWSFYDALIDRDGGVWHNRI